MYFNVCKMLIYDLLTMANEVLSAYMFYVLFFSGYVPVCLLYPVHLFVFFRRTWSLNNVMDLIAAGTLFCSLHVRLYSNVESYLVKNVFSR